MLLGKRNAGREDAVFHTQVVSRWEFAICPFLLNAEPRIETKGAR